MKTLIIVSIFFAAVSSAPITCNVDDLGRPPTNMPCIIGNCLTGGFHIYCTEKPDQNYVYGIHCLNPPAGYYCFQDQFNIRCQCASDTGRCPPFSA